jgi:hypothetical protein
VGYVCCQALHSILACLCSAVGLLGGFFLCPHMSSSGSTTTLARYDIEFVDLHMHVHAIARGHLVTPMAQEACTS